MITGVKHPEWEPPPMEGVVDIEGKVFLDEPGIGACVFWPRGVRHRLWTTDTGMTTLMVHPGGF